jgi:hypothetical protein
MSKPKSAPQKTVKQHYVPRHYLKNFKDAEGKLWVYNKESDVHFDSGETKVAFENNFYDMVDGSMEGGAAERWNDEEIGEKAITRFDQELDRVLKLLLSEGEYVGVRFDIRTATAFAMAIQHMRTAAFRERLNKSVCEGYNELARDLTKLNFPGQEHLSPTVTISEAMLKHEHVKTIFDYNHWRLFGDAISAHHWAFCIAPSGAEFITSDEPVSMRFHYAGKGLDSTGIKSKGAEIVYPLSRRFALVTREKSLPQFATTDGCPMKVTSEFVQYCNFVVAANCRRFVFGGLSDFATIRGFFDQNPKLRTRPWGQWESTSTKPRWVKENGKKQLKSYMISQLKFLDIDWGV